jgi:hypothetical protein
MLTEIDCFEWGVSLERERPGIASENGHNGRLSEEGQEG